VLKNNELSLDYFVKEAERELREHWATPNVSHSLKSAIEYFIDEKVFNSQVPRKFSKNKENMYRDRLKEIGNNPLNIDVLKQHRDTLSSRWTHLSGQQQSNPLDATELNTIIAYLKS
jgi:hypothetical protein